ncbi:MAG: C25 family cysteine peptidase, partial [candidate division WOR-3 bacterium]
MKKVFYLLVIISVLKSYEISFSPSDIEIKNENGYDRIYLKNSFHLPSPVGAPEVPFVIKKFLIRENKKVTGIEIEEVDSFLIQGEYNLYPVQPPFEMQLPPPQFVEPDPEYYSLPFFPQKIIDTISTGYRFSYKICGIKIFPVRYYPAEKKIVLYTYIKFRITEKDTYIPHLTPLRRSKVSRNIVENEIKKYVDNPESLNIFYRSLYEEKKPEFKITEFPSYEGLPVDLVIVTSSEFEDYFKNIAERRKRQGIMSVIKTTSWINSHYAGNDLSDKIRNFLKDCIIYWGTVFFLIGGDYSIVPSRTDQGQVYDYFYSDLENDKEIDLYVGRVPSKTVSDINKFLNKLQTYEDSPHKYYLKTILLCGGSSHDSRGEGAITKENIQLEKCGNLWNYDYPDDYFTWEMYGPKEDTSSSHKWEGDEELRRDNFINRLNNGVGDKGGFHIINHIDHSHVHCLGTGFVTGGGSLHIQDVELLTNENKYFIIYSHGCYPNNHHYDCISKRLINYEKGAIAFIGYSTTGLWNCDKQDFAFFERLFGCKEDREKYTRYLGFCFAAVLDHPLLGAGYSFLIKFMNLLGDPSMPIHIIHYDHDTLLKFYVEGIPDMIYTGPQNINIKVKQNETNLPVEGALVCIYKPGEVFETGYTDENGEISLEVCPKGIGSIHISVLKPTYKEFHIEKEVLFSGLSFLFIKSFEILDTIIGNHDGVANPGEKIRLKIYIENGGSQMLYDVKGNLETFDEYIIPENREFHFGNIPAGSVAEGIYIIKIRGDCKNRYGKFLKFKFYDFQFMEWYDSLFFTIKGDSVIYASSRLKYLGDNIYTFDDFHIENCLDAYATGIELYLEPAIGQIVMSDSCEYVGNILPFQEVILYEPFKFQATSLPATIPFYLKIKKELRPEFVDKFIVKINNYSPEIKELWAAQNFAKLSFSFIPSYHKGYNIYRSTDNLNYVKINNNLVRDSLFFDYSVLPYHKYYYKIVNVDTYGNESNFSPCESVFTNPPEFPGFPLENVGYVNGSIMNPVIYDINPYSDGKEIVFCAGNKVYCVSKNGEILWERDVLRLTHASPTIVKAGGTVYIAVTSSNEAKSRFNIFRWDGEKVWEHEINEDRASCAPVAYDVDRDGDDEVIFCAKRIVCVKKNHLQMWEIKWEREFNKGRIWGTPCICDDGIVKIGVGFSGSNKFYILRGDDGDTLISVPFPSGSTILSSPVCGNFYGDEKYDFVVQVYYKDGIVEIYIVEQTGETHYLKRVSQNTGSPLIYDFNGDKILEIAVIDQQVLKIIDAQGCVVASFPLKVKEFCSPILANLDNDEEFEILIKGINFLYGIDFESNKIFGFPYYFVSDDYSIPQIDDLDCDGYSEIVAYEVGKERLRVWKTNIPYMKSKWYAFHGNYKRDGFYPYEAYAFNVDWDALDFNSQTKIEKSLSEIHTIIKDYKNRFKYIVYNLQGNPMFGKMFGIYNYSDIAYDFENDSVSIIFVKNYDNTGKIFWTYGKNYTFREIKEIFSQSHAKIAPPMIFYDTLSNYFYLCFGVLKIIPVNGILFQIYYSKFKKDEEITFEKIYERLVPSNSLPEDYLISLCIGQNKNPHILFSLKEDNLKGEIYHLWYENNLWNIENVSNSYEYDSKMPFINHSDGRINIVWSEET